MRIALVIFLLPLLRAASDRPADLEALADLARSAPPEFAADALIRLAGLERAGKPWRVELLEEAFRMGGAAPTPFRPRPAVTRFEGQGRFLERAYGQELDALSLRMRALDAMLPLDPARARKLFGELGPPRPPALTCKDALVPEVARFYTVLGKVADQTFSAKEVQEEEHYKLLLRHTALTSPAQVGPVAALLASARLTDPQFQALANGFVAGLKQLRGDDRSFSQARFCGIEIRKLSLAMEKRGMNRVGLLEAYREYLAWHLSTVRCADSAVPEVRLVIETIATSIAETQAAGNPGPYFNDALRIDPIPPLSIQEQTPARQEGEAEGLKGCDSPECTAAGRQYRDVAMKSEGVAFTPAERESAEWQNRLKSAISALEDWKQDTGFTAAEHFRFKVSLYGDLLAVAPPGPSRDAVLRATHEFLRQSRLEIPSRTEWFFPVSVLIGRVGVDPMGLAKLGEELAESPDAVIALYARLERVAPRSPDKIIALF